jgi:aminoglycoside 6'-N-acetyltransferase I
LPPADIAIRRLTAADRGQWSAMRIALYTEADPSAQPDELAAEIGGMLAREDWAAFAAATSAGDLVGLIELFERNYAEGCDTSPVTYIEGLWVAPNRRKSGIARSLVMAGVDWGRSRGRSEIASDVQLANARSQTVHERLGFEETERLVTYRMSIASAGK